MNLSTYAFHRLALLATIALAAILRLAWLGQESLWFDEIVTMRLARSAGAGAMFQLLEQIDATRAPLHPLLLQRWIVLFGPSDYAGRGFSVLCGVATVAIIFGIGKTVYDTRSGLWAAWLCAWSPLMVMYSREARMYAWMVFVTATCWWLLFSFRSHATLLRRALYAMGLAALVLSHPLGILMATALAIAALLDLSVYRLTLRGWFLLHGTSALLVSAWLPHYFDHPPSYMVGQLPIRFLFGLPIGFVGGDFRVLAVCSAVIAFGLWNDLRRSEGSVLNPNEQAPSIGGAERAAFTRSLLIWFIASPLMLYAYAKAAHPVFGPARYTLYVGPAYLLLLGRGLVLLPRAIRFAGAGTLLIFALRLLETMVYTPGLKADWRGAAVYLDQHDPDATIVVLNAKVDAARYYLGNNRRILPRPAKVDELANLPEAEASRTWFAHERPSGRVPTPLPKFLAENLSEQTTLDFPGLRLHRKTRKQPSNLRQAPPKILRPQFY